MVELLESRWIAGRQKEKAKINWQRPILNN
jgi:hypothetical protein